MQFRRRINLKLLLAAICVIAGTVILWDTFGRPRTPIVVEAPPLATEIALQPTAEPIIPTFTLPPALPTASSGYPAPLPSPLPVDQPGASTVVAYPPPTLATALAPSPVLPTAQATALVSATLVAPSPAPQTVVVPTAVPAQPTSATTGAVTPSVAVAPTVQAVPAATSTLAPPTNTLVATAIATPIPPTLTLAPTIGAATATPTPTATTAAATLTPSPVTVVYRVEGTAENVVILYYSYEADDLLEVVGPTLPWTLTLQVPPETPVEVSADSDSELGVLSCAIEVNRAVAANDSATDPPDAVTCEKIAR